MLSKMLMSRRSGLLRRVRVLTRCCSNRSAAGTPTDSVASTVARSLRDVARDGPRVRELQLPASEDLVCRNLMCEHVGDACACRLALVLERVPQLQTMDLSQNQLRALPDSAFQLLQLTRLDVSRNALMELSPRIAELQALEVLDVRANRLAQLPERALLALPKLREVRVTGNPPALLASVRSPELRAKLVIASTDEDV